MIVKLGETKSQIVNNQTIDGIMLDVMLYHGTANTAFLSTAFVPSDVQIKVELKRNNSQMSLMADNMQLLGIYSAKDQGSVDWFNGNIRTYPAIGVKSSKLYSLFIPFGGCINLKGSDELVISVICGRSVWSSAVDSALSYIDFNYNVAIGYELYTPQIRSQVVQAAIQNEKYSMGDRVGKIMFVNYDKDSFAEADQVINNISINSDKLSATFNFIQLWNRFKNCLFPTHYQLRYAATQPSLSDEALPYLPKFPQSLTIFVGTESDKATISNCSINSSYTAGNVTASNNFWVWTNFIQTQEIVQKALTMATKHVEENIKSIPVS